MNLSITETIAELRFELKFLYQNPGFKSDMYDLKRLNKMSQHIDHLEQYTRNLMMSDYWAVVEKNLLKIKNHEGEISGISIDIIINPKGQYQFRMDWNLFKVKIL